ncbi:class A beta-lactamase [Streptomyces dioscori]|uniref:Beta-lactamase n=1 Tax=Streptomyces dioscori TaxID=2109333 RepID=A0A2P8PXG6_9ACTN|nr:class A beta-lactamase [Streptomyces dioscori]PSM38679.1 class A beta-lactamase [Streptomyces dioscori]
MNSSPLHPTRRTALTLSAAVGAGAALVTGAAPSAHAAAKPTPKPNTADHDTVRALAELERTHNARLGVYAHNTATGKTVRYRADETFPMCSVFKTLTAAAVLRDLDRRGEFLDLLIRYTEQDLKDAGGSPVTGRPDNLAGGMTVAALCHAAMAHSDNAAANLLLRELGGPTAITRFCRSIGDPTTRLDRWEPALNSAEPWRTTDITSPAAAGRTYAKLALGDALVPRDRRQLTEWLLANTTSTNRFRKGLPADWALGDKTGTGKYGTTNDVGIAWTPAGAPVVLSVLSTKPDPDALMDEPLVARAAELLAAALG